MKVFPSPMNDKKTINNNILEKISFIEQVNNSYYSPREIGYRTPKGLDEQEMLSLIQSIRHSKAELLYFLQDQEGKVFRYCKFPRLEKMLHEIDIQRAAWQQRDATDSVLSQLFFNNLIDEAYYSSWIEGARTTHQKAKELMLGKISPQDRSERMVLNNFKTLEFLLKNLEKPLSHEFVCDLHRLVVDRTLDPEDEACAGKYREDQNYVQNAQGEIIYTPPSPEKVHEMMDRFCAWSNVDDAESFFLHPVLKAASMHFYFVHVHPFVDGNGRTARALMYYYLLKHGYEFMKFFSISKAIAADKKNYYQALKNVQDNECDLTYFFMHAVKMVLEAISTVEAQKQNENSLVGWLETVKSQGIVLNSRQEKLFRFHFREGVFPVTIKKYVKMTKVVYQTGRSDLLDLTDKGLLQMSKKGKEFVFEMAQKKK